MNRHMVEETGSRFFELASSLGRIHADTLSGLADVTAKTPLGPVFAINASLVRMANDGMETLASRMSAAAPLAPEKAAKPVPKPAPAPVSEKVVKPAPVKAKKPAPTPVLEKAADPAPVKAKKPAPAPVLEKAAKPAPVKAEKPAPFSIDAAPSMAALDIVEPEAADVLLDDAMIEDVLAEVETAPIALADKDDLTLINGIGATTAKKLNGVGIESFAQIAAMGGAEFTTLLDSLDIRTIRFSPDAWIAEAKTLSSPAH